MIWIHYKTLWGRKKMIQSHSPRTKDFYIRFEQFQCLGFSVAVLRQDDNDVIQPFTHKHDDYEFIIPITPMPGLKNDNAVYFGEPGVVYPVATGRTHGVAYPIYGVSHTDIIVDKIKFETLMKGCNGRMEGAFNYEFTATPKLLNWIKLFKEEFGKSHDKCEASLQALSTLICIELIRLGGQTEKDDRHETLGYHYDIKEAMDQMLMNCCSPIQIDELAKQYGMSKCHFIRVFTKMSGDSPYAFVLRARLAKAKQLLLHDAASITEIGLKCGFNSSSHFSDLFKKKNGMSPNEYRQHYAPKG